MGRDSPVWSAALRHPQHGARKIPRCFRPLPSLALPAEPAAPETAASGMCWGRVWCWKIMALLLKRRSKATVSERWRAVAISKPDRSLRWQSCKRSPRGAVANASPAVCSFLLSSSAWWDHWVTWQEHLTGRLRQLVAVELRAALKEPKYQRDSATLPALRRSRVSCAASVALAPVLRSFSGAVRFGERGVSRVPDKR